MFSRLINLGLNNTGIRARTSIKPIKSTKIKCNLTQYDTTVNTTAQDGVYFVPALLRTSTSAGDSTPATTSW
jgi:hypothetical protein